MSPMNDDVADSSAALARLALDPFELELERNPARVYLDPLAPGSRPAMRAALRRIAGLVGLAWERLPWHFLRYEHTSAIRARLLELGLAPSTVNRCLSALRGVLGESLTMGLLSAQDHAHAV